MFFFGKVFYGGWLNRILNYDHLVLWLVKLVGQVERLTSNNRYILHGYCERFLHTLIQRLFLLGWLIKRYSPSIHFTTGGKN